MKNAEKSGEKTAKQQLDWASDAYTISYVHKF